MKFHILAFQSVFRPSLLNRLLSELVLYDPLVADVWGIQLYRLIEHILLQNCFVLIQVNIEGSSRTKFP